ncbi:MAG: hypothetical protein AB2L11_12970 [Syntrophobacteraceae bacterium]
MTFSYLEQAKARSIFARRAMGIEERCADRYGQMAKSRDVEGFSQSLIERRNQSLVLGRSPLETDHVSDVL